MYLNTWNYEKGGKKIGYICPRAQWFEQWIRQSLTFPGVLTNNNWADSDIGPQKKQKS